MSALKIDGQYVVETIELSDVYDGWSIATTDDGRHWNRWDKTDHPGRYEATRAWMQKTHMLDAGEQKTERNDEHE